MTPHLSSHLVRELRSDHAGETGAVYIYKGIEAVAQWRGDVELLNFAKPKSSITVMSLPL